MLFDWFTLVAQLVNFLVLVWLLKRFLYKPILNAVAEREKRIVLQLQEAEASKEEAGKQLQAFQQKNIDFDQQRQDMLNKAIGEVNNERQKLLEESRKEAETLRLRLQETLRAEQQSLSSEIASRTRTEVFAIARKTLADLASASLEGQMVEVFIKRLNEINADERELMQSALQKASFQATIRCVMEVSYNQTNTIKASIEALFKKEVKINFEIQPNLVNGIELVVGGYKISWNIDDYLTSLETSVAEVLK